VGDRRCDFPYEKRVLAEGGSDNFAKQPLLRDYSAFFFFFLARKKLQTDLWKDRPYIMLKGITTGGSKKKKKTRPILQRSGQISRIALSCRDAHRFISVNAG